MPNHVAVGQGDNRWWLDLLEKGEGSAYADWFDVDWRSDDPLIDGRILAPFLGTPYAEALASGDLAVEDVGGRLAVVAYGSHVFPLRPEDQRIDPAAFADPQALHALCERQHWRLAWWKTADDAINWRRFFNVTELAGIRVERDDVFDAVHALPLRLYAQGLIDGVRVDHVDGLADPAGYCRKLRTRLDAAGEWRPADAHPGPPYLVVEKILAEGEPLDPDWRTDGTSGYDFMNQVAAIIHDPASAQMLGDLWHEISGRPAAFAPEEQAARQEVLSRTFAGQLDQVAGAFRKVALSDLSTRDMPLAALRRAIAALICSFSVYRTYGTGDAAPAQDAPLRDKAVARAQALAGPADADLVARIGDWLAGEGPGDVALRADAVRRFQQLSAPIAAKAVEDTAFYRYGRLLSGSDVGFDPDQFATGARIFGRAVLTRAEHHPHAMLATATHDHKRGEDVRARLAVLSERPERWAAFARPLGLLGAADDRSRRCRHAPPDHRRRLAAGARRRRCRGARRLRRAAGGVAAEGAARGQAPLVLGEPRRGVRGRRAGLSALAARPRHGVRRRSRSAGRRACAGGLRQGPGPDRAALYGARRARSLPGSRVLGLLAG